MHIAVINSKPVHDVEYHTSVLLDVDNSNDATSTTVYVTYVHGRYTGYPQVTEIVKISTPQDESTCYDQLDPADIKLRKALRKKVRKIKSAWRRHGGWHHVRSYVCGMLYIKEAVRCTRLVDAGRIIRQRNSRRSGTTF